MELMEPAKEKVNLKADLELETGSLPGPLVLKASCGE
jgi:hypothetical protein